MRNIIFLLATLTCSLNAYAGFDMNANCRKAYIEIINLRFDAGRKLLADEKLLNPENDIPYYLDNYIDFFTAVVGEKKSDFIKFKENIPKRIKRLENADKFSPYYKYCLADIYFQYGLTRIKFNEYFSGVYDLNKAYNLLEKNKKEFPEFILNLKILGMLHILINNIQENHKWTKTILRSETSTAGGLKEIFEVLNTSLVNKEYNYLKTECLYIYTYVIFNIIKDYTLIPELMNFYNDTAFYTEVRSSPLLKHAFAKILIYTGDNDKAIELLTSYNPDTTEYPFYYLEYLTARAKLNRLDKDTYKYLFSFLQNFDGMFYIKSGYQKLAWYYLVSGDTDKYREYIGKVLIYGTEIIDDDKQAQHEAKSGILPNIKLLKARLLFDGGYYSDAMKILVDIDKETELKCFRDSLEYTYRLARIYHRTGKIKEAILSYKRTYELGSGENFYFAANSALKLGEIFEKANNYSHAENYYKKCLKLNYSEYKNSIDRDAKRGLNRLNIKT